MNQKTIYTIGHSTRTFEEFVELLRAHGVEELVDVRTVPRSLHVPQFNEDVLGTALSGVSIGYRHLAKLGGLRHAKKDSTKNMGWRNASFRGYADYMGTPDFAEGLEELVAVASQKTTAIMCAEAVPWRCHRSMIGDALTVRGWTVMDIVSATSTTPHRVTPFLVEKDGEIMYPAPL